MKLYPQSFSVVLFCFVFILRLSLTKLLRFDLNLECYYLSLLNIWGYRAPPSPVSPFFHVPQVKSEYLNCYLWRQGSDFITLLRCLKHGSYSIREAENSRKTYLGPSILWYYFYTKIIINTKRFQRGNIYKACQVCLSKPLCLVKVYCIVLVHWYMLPVLAFFLFSLQAMSNHWSWDLGFCFG